MSGKAHVLVLVMTLATIGFIIHLVRRRQLRAKYSILWISLGLVLLPLAASPRILDRVSIWLGISYGPATFFLFATALLFLVTIHFSWELSRLEERSRLLAEELALLRERMGEPPEEVGISPELQPEPTPPETGSSRPSSPRAASA